MNEKYYKIILTCLIQRDYLILSRNRFIYYIFIANDKQIRIVKRWYNLVIKAVNGKKLFMKLSCKLKFICFCSQTLVLVGSLTINKEPFLRIILQ